MRADAAGRPTSHHSHPSPRTNCQIAIADSRGFTDHSGLVVEPQEAERVFGKEVASNLKLNQHGNVVLYPQPFDDPNDPQNVRGYHLYKISCKG